MTPTERAELARLRAEQGGTDDVEVVLLSADEARELAECEAVIERGLKTFWEVGRALQHIRDARLYRRTHANFKAYCVERWGMDDSYATRHIQAAEVGALLPIGNSPVPKNESVARALAPLLDDPEELLRAWREAVDVYSPEPTAKQVREVVQRRRRPAKAKPRAVPDRPKLTWEEHVLAEVSKPLVEAVERLGPLAVLPPSKPLLAWLTTYRQIAEELVRRLGELAEPIERYLEQTARDHERAFGHMSKEERIRLANRDLSPELVEKLNSGYPSENGGPPERRILSEDELIERLKREFDAVEVPPEDEVAA